MPRLSQECFKAACDYIDLRYNHWPPEKLLERRNKTIKALKKLSKAEQDDYAKRAREFIASNTQVLSDLEDADERARLNAMALDLLQMPRSRVTAAIVRNRGNVNNAMAELNAADDKQHTG